MSAPTPGPSEDRFCARCGEVATDGDHARCERALVLEPPRYCTMCRRRMVVQVVPTGWTARCAEYGELSSTR